MFNETVLPLKRSDKTVAQLLALTFPNYTGRKIKAVAKETLFLDSTMDDGSGSYWAIVNLATMEVYRVPMVSPMTAHMKGSQSLEWNLAWGKTETKPNFAYVTHNYFCGQETGITIYIHPTTLNNTLLAGATK